MEPSSLSNKPNSYNYFVVALFLLSAGLVFGLLGALQYIIPGFLKEYLSFEKIRPLHVSSVVFWIILAATGSTLTYVQQHTKRKIYSSFLMKAQLAIFVFAIAIILISYIIGVFGGREYWEFPPLLALPIAIGWILFLFNVFKSLKGLRNQPVYVWMWMTGCVFFLFTFLESYLWIFPYFRNNIIHDMTIQWKSYGSIVGSWNMLIYGCSIFLMDKISESTHYSYSRIAFSLYFLGLFNLMFNWGHHIYTLPTHDYVKNISYLVSMTELLIFGRIIYSWKSSLTQARKNLHIESYRFLLAADIWVFLTLFLAILMSIPSINVYTHGTHITVAHTMGATIGINTMLLFAFCFDILKSKNNAANTNHKYSLISWAFTNISLLIFWITLIVAGVLKAKWQMAQTQIPFSSMMKSLQPAFIIFFLAGCALVLGLVAIIQRILRSN
ncbi:MAG: cbb3-type cytochrome c oxidase subunit I [Bacteroidetes bacterium]|nr:cbb3-type cytochrome c oxidase subunit I [Bacteroidota bacterium]